MQIGKKMRGAILAQTALAALLLAAAPFVQAQATRYLGTVTAISGDTITVKTDAGDVHPVEVPSTAQLKRIEPGQTDLSKAETLDFSSLDVGDRVLVNIDPSATGPVPQALRIIAIKQADVALKQQAEAEAWSQGVHGLVKSVDPAAGVIVVSVRQGPQTRDVTVNTTKSTVLKRYAPGSVRFDQAQPGPIDAIRPGDQLWARGTKNADDTAIAAEAVVSGSFLSIGGTVLSTDSSASTITVKDLTTKKPVTIRVTADAELRRLDDNVAAFIAARLKAAQETTGEHPAGGAPNAGGGPQHPFRQGAGRMDLETVLERAPAIQLTGLKKGEAVMIVATQDATGVSAIKLLAGVEPLLESPGVQNLLSDWSLGQGDSEAGVE